MSDPLADPLQEISLDPSDLMNALAIDARAIDAAAQRLGSQVKLFEGAKDGQLGVKLRWEAALDQAHHEVQEAMIAEAKDPEVKLSAGLKTWSSKVIEARARIKAKEDNTALWIEFCEMEAEVRALQMWIRAKERSSSLRQSILSSQKMALG
jgi:hypothetical protein